MLPDPESSADRPDPSPDVDRLFEASRGAQQPGDAGAGGRVPDEALDALQAAVESRLAAADGDEAVALRERLESLRALRAEARG